MYPKKLALGLLLFLMNHLIAGAQNTQSITEADRQSYALYETGKWRELLEYSRDYLNNKGEDFIYLRMRMGYAAFMLNNFSEAIKHYDLVLKTDNQNAVAHYYIKECRQFLKQDALADFHRHYLSEKSNYPALTEAYWEGSFKTTNTATRRNALFNTLMLSSRLTRKLHMQHAFSAYNQQISETGFPAVVNNTNIQIDQLGYYNRTTFSLSRKLQLKAAYHYTRTPFNNFSYNNHIGMIGIRYLRDYWSMEASALAGTLTDTSLQQYDVQIALYPLGNLNLYFITTGVMRQRNSKQQFNLQQTGGIKLHKKVWLQGNVTIGGFQNYFENDGFYLYNSIDPNVLKTGGNLFFTANSKLTIQLGYTFEQKQLYNKAFYYYQHSITGGLSCKF